MIKKFQILIFLLIAVGLSFVPVFMYAKKFGVPINFELSDSQSDWADFGSFAGGVVGPIYSFLAFLGLAFTIALQTNQISEFRKSAHLQELQRLLEKVSEEIVVKLNSYPIVMPSSIIPSVGKLTLEVFLRAHGHTSVHSLKWPGSISEPRLKRIKDDLEFLGADFSSLGVLVDHLSWAGLLFMKDGGSDVLRQYYLKKHNSMVCGLHALGFIPEGSSTLSFFEPVAYRDTLIPERANFA